MLFGLISCKNTEKEQFNKEALEEILTDFQGNKTNFGAVLETLKGNVVIIDIWASWCPDCVKAMPKLKKLQEDFPTVKHLFLSYDKDMESWKKGVEKHGIAGEHYLINSDWKGGQFKDNADIDWIPRYILMDEEGKIALYRAINADDENLIEKLKTLLK